MMNHSHRKRYRIDFRALMAQCEANYARAMQLVRAMGDGDGMALDVASGRRSWRVDVKVLERCRYTTILRFEQEALHDTVPGAALTVRLYHDMKLAEVTEARPWRRVQARNDYPNHAMHMPDEKHQWNVFLGEWLSHMRAHAGVMLAQG